jgi:hypothetical protein
MTTLTEAHLRGKRVWARFARRPTGGLALDKVGGLVTEQLADPSVIATTRSPG